MDRHSFLKCQPFLIPLPSVSWPPPMPVEYSLEKGTRDVLIRDNYSLSIEPYADKSSRTSLGPAFFRVGTSEQSQEQEDDHEDTDPAMCDFELALFQLKPSSSSAKSPSTTTLTSPAERSTTSASTTGWRTPGTSRKGAATAASEEAALFFYIQGKTYQADLCQIQDIIVQMDPDDNTTSRVQKPPSMLIYFSHCIFRVFSLDAGYAADQFSFLGSVKTQIANVLTSDKNIVCPFPANFLALVTATHTASPATPSGGHTSSNELGQKETTTLGSGGSLMAIHGKIIMEDDDNDQEEEEEASSAADNDTATKEESVEDVCTVTQNCRESLDRTLQNLELLSHVMKLPASASAGMTTLEKQAQMSQLLTTGIAENFAASFGTRTQITEALSIYNQEMKTCRTELQALTKAFMPSSSHRARKRARYNSLNSEESRLLKPPPPPPSPEECIAKSKELLKRHKEALRAKYRLALLPSRG